MDSQASEAYDYAGPDPSNSTPDDDNGGYLGCCGDSNIKDHITEKQKEERENFQAEFGVLTSWNGYLIIHINLFFFAVLTGVAIYTQVKAFPDLSGSDRVNVIIESITYYFLIDFLVLAVLVNLAKFYAKQQKKVSIMMAQKLIKAAFRWYQFFCVIVACFYGYVIFTNEHCSKNLGRMVFAHNVSIKKVHMKDKVNDYFSHYCIFGLTIFGLLVMLAILRMMLVLQHSTQMICDMALLSVIQVLEGVKIEYDVKINKFIRSELEKHCRSPKCDHDESIFSLQISFYEVSAKVLFSFAIVYFIIAVLLWVKHRDHLRMARLLMKQDYSDYQDIWKKCKPKPAREADKDDVKKNYAAFTRIDAQCRRILGFSGKRRAVNKLKRKSSYFALFSTPLRQPVRDLNVLLVHAEFVHEWFNNILRELHKQLKGSCTCDTPMEKEDDPLMCGNNECGKLLFKVPPLKTKNRAREKIQRNYQGQSDAVLDIARGSIVCQDFRDILRLLKLLKADKKANAFHGEFTVEQITNRFRVDDDKASSTAGYRDLQLKIRATGYHFTSDITDPRIKKLLEDPEHKMQQHIAELQIHLPQFCTRKIKQGETGSGFREKEYDIETGLVNNPFNLTESLKDVRLVHSWFQWNKNTTSVKEAKERLDNLSGHEKYKLYRSLLDA
eukprot:m.5692 g.5692  ORF g.5692 m.5692 type:complete len:667 (+) comp3364_c0_seq1:74-2074(+)